MPNTEPANKPFISYKLLHKNRNVSLFLSDGLTIKIAQISRSAKIDDDRDIYWSKIVVVTCLVHI